MSETKSAIVNVPIYPSLKEEAESIFEFHGLSLPDAITIFLHHACYSGGFPFELSSARWTDPESLEAMKEAIQLANDPTAKSYKTVADMRKDILNGDYDD